MTLKLTEEEVRLFQRLSAVPSCIVRVVGGWVRDKLLGRHTADFDLVVEGLTAEEYAEQLCKGGNGVTRTGAIKINEQAGKHVAVTPLRIDNFTFDIVALRGKLGSTPTLVGDALMRDFTVNAMYYDVRDHQLQDPTGKGFRDLELRVLCTPLPPLETLTYDALRALRAVRFASRLGFAIDAELQNAIKSETIRSLLRNNISRARYLIELEKMLGYPTALNGLRLLCAADLCSVVFFPRAEALPRENHVESAQKARGLAVAEAMCSNEQTLTECQLDRWIAVLTSFLCGYYYTDASTELPLTKFHLTREWKWTNRHTEAAVEILLGVRAFAGFVTSPQTTTRLSVGLLLRKLKTMWGCSFIESEALLLSFASASDHEAIKTSYTLLRQRIAEWQLLQPPVWELQPLIRGAELAELFNVSGPAVGELATLVLSFQLGENAPRRNDREACLQWLRGRIG